jgi:SAM-dependent methyltransferase
MDGRLLAQQAEWLAPARGKLLRWGQIAQRRRVLDLGAGMGSTTAELTRRTEGVVVGVDCELGALKQGTGVRVAGLGERLPFRTNSFDLVLTQLALLYMDLPTAVGEMRRILQPGGAILCLEPDYGGMIEYPPAIVTQPLWLAGLRRLGATPEAGRMLPSLLAGQGLRVEVHLLELLTPPAPERFAFLRSLPLTEAELAQLGEVERVSEGLRTRPWGEVAHLPLFLIHASLPLSF